MSYNSASMDNFAPAYDIIIERALMLVNKDQEYTANSESLDQGRKRTYRLIFVDSLALLVTRSAVFWAATNVRLNQAIDLDKGWAYLPNDFLTFYDPVSHKAISTPDIVYKNNHAIIAKAGESINYLRLPLEIDEFPIVFVDALKYLFLRNCIMLDVGFQALGPLIEEKYRNSLFNLDAEINNVIIAKKRRRYA